MEEFCGTRADCQEARDGADTATSTRIEHPDAVVLVEDFGAARVISVEPKGDIFVPLRRWKTGYPVELIEHVLHVKGPGYLCDEIMRDEDPLYVEHHLRWNMLAHSPPEYFAGRRILDFGSGSGSSSMVLARLFPNSEIAGVELEPEFVELARHRARFYGVEDRVTFHLSPGPEALPDLGAFDVVVFSAVFEHLLPEERRSLFPLVFKQLKPGGVLFLDQTPYRWFPIELHTTGLPLINYLPAPLAGVCARRLSRRPLRMDSWAVLLRKGIRGGTVGEIMGLLDRAGHRAKLIAPSRLGVRDHIDLWYRLSSSTRRPQVKRLMMRGFRLIKAVTGLAVIPTLSLAIRRQA